MNTELLKQVEEKKEALERAVQSLLNIKNNLIHWEARIERLKRERDALLEKHARHQPEAVIAC